MDFKVIICMEFKSYNLHGMAISTSKGARTLQKVVLHLPATVSIINMLKIHIKNDCHWTMICRSGP